MLRIKTTECRIGVVGLYNAGKTVFLTSLINHLENHDPDRFPLGKPNTTIRKFRPQPTDKGWSPFNYAGFRDALVHQGKWPEKTLDRSMYACRFERSDWQLSDAIVNLYDLPGERLADAAMMNRDFAGWSDYVLNRIHNDTPYRVACAGFLDELKRPEVNEAHLIHAYKVSLANLILSYKPLISPSAFLLDARGSVARPDTPENLAKARCCGLDASSEFTPLSPELREANPELVYKFAQHFEAYRNGMAVPYLKALKSCHSLIVLVDITMLLAGGVGMYDDHRQILHDLFDVLDPGENSMMTLGRHLAKVFLPHDLRPGWIHRVAFVAPKMDLVHPTDRDRTVHLLRRLVGNLAVNRDGLKHQYFNCAAVVSTKLLPQENGERLMVGIPFRDANGRKLPPGVEQRFGVSALPDDWPATWKPGDFHYPEVYPTIPARKDCPPEQINLDKVLQFAMDL